MKAFSDRWNVFTTALGSRRYAVADIAKLAVVAAAAIYLYWYGRDMSAVEVALTVLFVVSALFFWVVLEYALKLTRQISDARLKLAQLRVSGVELRNDIVRVTDRPRLEDWKARTDAWSAEVQSELGKISKSDAVWFSVLDVVPPPRVELPVLPFRGAELDQVRKSFREPDRRLAILGEMIRELWVRR